MSTASITLNHPTGTVTILIQAGTPAVAEHLRTRIKELFTAPRTVEEAADRMIQDQVDVMRKRLGL